MSTKPREQPDVSPCIYVRTLSFQSGVRVKERERESGVVRMLEGIGIGLTDGLTPLSLSLTRRRRYVVAPLRPICLPFRAVAVAEPFRLPSCDDLDPRSRAKVTNVVSDRGRRTRTSSAAGGRQIADTYPHAYLHRAIDPNNPWPTH